MINNEKENAHMYSVDASSEEVGLVLDEDDDYVGAKKAALNRCMEYSENINEGVALHFHCSFL